MAEQYKFSLAQTDQCIDKLVELMQRQRGANYALISISDKFTLPVLERMCTILTYTAPLEILPGIYTYQGNNLRNLDINTRILGKLYTAVIFYPSEHLDNNLIEKVLQ